MGKHSKSKIEIKKDKKEKSNIIEKIIKKYYPK